MNTFRQIISVGICIIELSGCATFKTLNADIPLVQRVFIYNGTGLMSLYLDECQEWSRFIYQSLTCLQSVEWIRL